MATWTRRHNVVSGKLEHQNGKNQRHEQHELEMTTKRERAEPMAHRDGLPTVRVTTAAMVSAAKEKAAFCGSGRSEALRAGVTRAQGRGGASVKRNWAVVPR